MSRSTSARPRERPLLQSFRKYPVTTSIPNNQLHQIASAIAETEDMPRQRISTQLVPNESRETIERATHVRYAWIQEDLRRRPETQHPRESNTDNTSASTGRETSPRTSRRLPHGRSMRITESRATCCFETTGTSDDLDLEGARFLLPRRSHPDTVDTGTPFESANSRWL